MANWRPPYTSWLAEPIDCSWLGTQPRYKVLRSFVREGLIPFLACLGYHITIDPGLLESRIASGLYDNQKATHLESEWLYGSEATEFAQEELWHYGDVVEPIRWEKFWTIWGDWDDVSLEAERGTDRRYDIEAFIWTQLDLDESPQTKYLIEFLGGDAHHDSHNHPSRGRDDTYIREAAESGQFEGKRR